MSYILKTINPDGTTSIERSRKYPALEVLQKAVGGYIEAVPGFRAYEGKACHAYFDEDGKRKELPINSHATALWHAQLAFPELAMRHTGVGGLDVCRGPVVIVQKDSE